MTHSQKLYEKSRHRFHRKHNAMEKENERLRCNNYQRKIDIISKSMRTKGNGLAHKIKGETMPTMLCANNRCAKSWKHLMRGESMKVGAYMKGDNETVYLEIFGRVDEYYAETIN